ncbi:class I SAM-dependent methyltransferase [bacterium]|nr:class I SAM-dependent methyltransferase [bacterium]
MTRPIDDPRDPAYRPPLDRDAPFPPQGEAGHPNLKELLYANLGTEQVVVDVGCGTGPFEYHRFAPQFIAFDMFEPDSREGMKPVDEFRLGRLETFPLEDESADAVVLGFILEHVPEPLVFLREAERVLRPGGWCYVAIPHHRSLEDRLFRLATRIAGSKRGPHIQRFTFTNFRQLTEEGTRLRAVGWHFLDASFLWMEHPKLRWARKPFVGVLKAMRAVGIDLFHESNYQILLQKK